MTSWWLSLAIIAFGFGLLIVGLRMDKHVHVSDASVMGAVVLMMSGSLISLLGVALLVISIIGSL